MVSVVFSRFGLWGFDLCETQIMQKCVESYLRGMLNATETAMTKVAWLLVCNFEKGVDEG
jgi:hypothetical protein